MIDLDAIRGRAANKKIPIAVANCRRQLVSDRDNLLIYVDALRSRLEQLQTCPSCGLRYTGCEGEDVHARLAEARANAFQDALDCMRDRQARDHLAACLQDKYGVWWKTDSADKDQFWSGLQAEIDAQWPEQPTSDKRQISPEANTDSASAEGEK